MRVCARLCQEVWIPSLVQSDDLAKASRRSNLIGSRGAHRVSCRPASRQDLSDTPATTHQRSEAADRRLALQRQRRAPGSLASAREYPGTSQPAVDLWSGATDHNPDPPRHLAQVLAPTTTLAARGRRSNPQPGSRSLSRRRHMRTTSAQDSDRPAESRSLRPQSNAPLTMHRLTIQSA
jgi:hypothetical protein